MLVFVCSLCILSAVICITVVNNKFLNKNNKKKLETIINKILKKLHTWLIVNRLSLNIDNKKILVFHPYNKPVKQRITIKIHKNAIT